MNAWLLIPAFIAGAYLGYTVCALMVAASKPTPNPDEWTPFDGTPEPDEGVELIGNPMARMDAAARRRRR